MDCISDEAQTKRMLAAISDDPNDPDRVQYHKEQQAKLLPGVRQFSAVYLGQAKMEDVLDLLALLMDELPSVKGWTKKTRKERGKKALIKAYERWSNGERM